MKLVLESYDLFQIRYPCEGLSMEFYTDTEPWNLPKNQYPTWDECMRYYMSRIKVKISQKTAIVDLAKDVEKIWKAGDGCPKHFHHIMTQFEKTVLVQYQKYRKGDQPGKSKKKKIQTPSKSPARRSVRQKSDDQYDHDPGTHQDQQDEVDHGADRTEASISISMRKESRDRKVTWMRDHGCQLFDVFSGEAMVKTLQEGFCFDADFYAAIFP